MRPARPSKRSAGVARRARIVLLAADGVPLDRIARQLGVDRNVVRTWVDRYRGGGAPRCGIVRGRVGPDLSPGGGAAPGAARL